MTPLVLSCLVLAADPPPAADPKPVPVTREDVKQALEDHKKARPRLPLPPADGPAARVNNGRFRAYYLPPEFRDFGFSRDPDPAMTLDNTYKVKLFWVSSRMNNCYYCLGHQEHKLTAAGVTDDDIAVLDGDWGGFPDKERAGLVFTRKLTVAPYALGPDDVKELTRFYTPAQAFEITVTVAGYNAMNRWTDGLNIPAEDDGAFFARQGVKADLSTFKTPTSPKFKDTPSRIAPLPDGAVATGPTKLPKRPELEPREQVEAALRVARSRTPVLPLADAAAAKELWGADDPPAWVRLLATFPKGMKGRAAGLRAGMEKPAGLSPKLAAAIAWTAARQDRAWYALAVARDRLKGLGLSDDQVWALDAGRDLTDAEKAALAVAAKLAATPYRVTDADVEGLRKAYTDKQVAEIVHHVCNAAFFNRVTEAAKLPVDR
jgi:AhpD family alkylhydroperoxidase